MPESQPRRRGRRVECVCILCQRSFQAIANEVKRNNAKFCSTACRDKHKSKPLTVRFWDKVNKNGPIPVHRPELGPCWLWTGSRRTGYGFLGATHRGGKNTQAHRASWELHCGIIPEGLWVLHRCDNRACVRPDHLFLGTHGDNLRDMLRKRRHILKLTCEQVSNLRALYAVGSASKSQLSREFGIDRKTVSRIIANVQNY